MTIGVGIFPVILLVFLVEIFLTKKNANRAVLINKLIHQDEDKDKGKSMIVVPETSRSDALTLEMKEFLFAKSDNNYTTFYYTRNGGVEKDLLRISLKNAQKQLAEFESIIRCHRTYLVNRMNIDSIEGNARSLNVRLIGWDELIPVSRTFPKEILTGASR